MATEQSKLPGTEDVAPVPSNACINYRECGEIVEHSGLICGPCLDAVRYADRGWQQKGYDTYPEWKRAQHGA